MAKRKRLGPARGFGDYDDASPALPETAGTEPDFGAGSGPDGSADTGLPALETKSMFPMGVARHAPPIARVAAEVAAEAALRDLAEDVRRARIEGGLVQSIALDAIDQAYLMRDRMVADPEEMAALVDSLRARGQQTPIEVVDLGDGRFGLISGWRRMQALRHLLRDTGEARFGQVQALLRRPETSAEAYRAMVEENEIRVGLSYYERARIVVRAAGQGVWPDRQAALSGLFASASRARRSKIGSFTRIVEALDEALRFAPAIPERLGLALVKRIDAEPGFAAALAKTLSRAAPASAEAEMALLETAARGADAGRADVSRAEADRGAAGVSADMSGDVTSGLASGPKDSVSAGTETVQGVSRAKHSDAGIASIPVPVPSQVPVGHVPVGDADAPSPAAIVAEAFGPGLRLSQRQGRVVIEGAGVDDAFVARLRDWLSASVQVMPKSSGAESGAD